MGLLSNSFLSRLYGCDPIRAPDLPGEDVGVLMEMERQIHAAQQRETLIRECTHRLLSGDRMWTAPLVHTEHWYGRQIEHAAIAEAFKAMKSRDTVAG